MLYACVQKFDVTGKLEKNLGTKQGLSLTLETDIKTILGF